MCGKELQLDNLKSLRELVSPHQFVPDPGCASGQVRKIGSQYCIYMNPRHLENLEEAQAVAHHELGHIKFWTLTEIIGFLAEGLESKLSYLFIGLIGLPATIYLGPENIFHRLFFWLGASTLIKTIYDFMIMTGISVVSYVCELLCDIHSARKCGKNSTITAYLSGELAKINGWGRMHPPFWLRRLIVNRFGVGTPFNSAKE